MEEIVDPRSSENERNLLILRSKNMDDTFVDVTELIPCSFVESEDFPLAIVQLLQVLCFV